MSRSYRRPYETAVCYRSSRWDKQLANSNYRKLVRARIKQHFNTDFEDFEIPHKFEADHNDTWSWSKDGKTRLQVPTAREWSRYCIGLAGWNTWYTKFYTPGVWPPEWYIKSLRK